ncbi:hypothetical protein AB205_0052410, partial [Aquarana catesbeiana]
MDCVTNQDSMYLPNSVSATLEDLDLWRQFHQEGTEMIITKSGRRMFPQCKIRLFGLHPYTKYVVLVDFIPLDNCRYKWNKNQWEAAGKAEPHPPCRTYVHPDSPAPVLLDSLQIILHSMHRYKPRFHIIQSDDVYNIRWGLLQVFSFPETEFTAVTAYQNDKITKLKIDHNPFAKGFREQERGSKRDDMLKLHPQSPSKRQKRKRWEDSPEAEDEDRSKNARVKEEPAVMPAEVYSQWVTDHEGGLHLHPNSPDLTDSPHQEQQVPSSSSRFLYRSPQRRCPQILPGSLDACEVASRRLTPDVATVPELDACQLQVFPPQHSVQERTSGMNFPMETPTRQTRPMYSPYTPDQWMVPTQGQYRPMGYSYSTDFGTQGPVNHPHNGMSDWSQYSLFPYTCW